MQKEIKDVKVDFAEERAVRQEGLCVCVQLWNLLNSHLASVNRYLGIWLEAFEGQLPFPFFVISFGLNHNGSQLRCCELTNVGMPNFSICCRLFAHESTLHPPADAEIMFF